jgi:hypothetical protein
MLLLLLLLQCWNSLINEPAQLQSVLLAAALLPSHNLCWL